MTIPDKPLFFMKFNTPTRILSSYYSKLLKKENNKWNTNDIFAVYYIRQRFAAYAVIYRYVTPEGDIIPNKQGELLCEHNLISCSHFTKFNSFPITAPLTEVPL